MPGLQRSQTFQPGGKNNKHAQDEHFKLPGSIMARQRGF